MNVDSATSKRKRSPVLDGNETVEESCESEKRVSKKKKQTCAQDKREEQVKDTTDKLREKHGIRYSPMQFHIWSEMILLLQARVWLSHTLLQIYYLCEEVTKSCS